MAGHAGEDPVEGVEAAHHRSALSCRSLAPQRVRQAGHQPRRIAVAEQCGQRAQHHAVLPERLDLETQRLHPLRVLSESGDRSGFQRQDQRSQQHLSLDLPLQPGGAHALVEHAFVGGVLVDEQQPTGSLQQQVGGEQLPQQALPGELQGGALGFLRYARHLEGSPLPCEQPVAARLADLSDAKGAGSAFPGARPGARLPGSLGRLCLRIDPAALGECLPNGIPDGPVGGLGISEAHFGLGGVDVHVECRRGQFEEEHGAGKATPGKHVAVDLQQGML